MSDSDEPRRRKWRKGHYARRAFCETLKQEGVVRLNARFARLLGLSSSPGVRVRRAWDGQLHIQVSVVVRYGYHVRKVGTSIQEAIRAAIQRISDEPVGPITVFIANVEFKD